MKHIFIVNPIAGTKEFKKVIKMIESTFESPLDYKILISEYKGHAQQLAFENSKEACYLYAVGGDGTAYEVLNGMQDSAVLGIIPTGTGNDFFKMLAQSKKSIQEIITETVNGKTINIDYGMINEKKCLNSCCFGIDAQIVARVNDKGRHSKLPRSLIYLASTIIKLLKPNTIDCKIILDTKTIEMEALLVTLMNGKYYGGGFMPAPTADFQDQVFELVMVQKLSIFKIFRLLPKYFSGNHQNIKEIETLQTSSFILESQKEFDYCVDGECFKEKKIEFKLIPNGLKLRVPEGVVNYVNLKK